MRIACPGCKSTYSVDDGKVPPAGLNMKCPRCSTVFAVKPPVARAPLAGPPPGAVAAMATASGSGAVPLPGRGQGAVPLPGVAPFAARPTPPPAGGAVPLPGTSPFAPAPTPRGVPLPGPGPFAPAPSQPSPFGAPPPPGRAWDDGFDAASEFEPFSPGPGAERVPLPPPPPPAGTVPLPGPAATGFDDLPSLADFDAPAPFAGDATRKMSRPPEMPPFGPPAVPLPGGGTTSLRAAPDPAFDFGAVDFGGPPPAMPPPPPDDTGPLDFGAAFEPPPPPPLSRADLFDDGLEFDPSAGPGVPQVPHEPSPEDAIREFLGTTPGPAAEGPALHVRRSSGKTFGPFPVETLRQMLAEGQLLGNEEVSEDGANWRPIGSIEGLATVPAGAQPPAFAPPVIGVPPEPPQPSPSEVLRMKPPSAADKAGEFVQRLRARVDRKVIAAAAAVAFVGTGGVLELATPYGFWFHKALLGYDGPAEGSPLARQLATARNEIRRDDFAAYQRAIAAAEAGLAEDPEDVHARALFAQAAFTLQRKFRAGAPLPQAQSHLDALVATAAGEPEVRKARAAAALQAGEPAKVADFLAPLLAAEPADVEALVLAASAQLALRQPAEAQALLDRAAAAAPNAAGVIHLQGAARLAQGDTAGAKARFEAALAADPQHGESAVELAALALEAGDAAAARTVLDQALSEKARPGLGGMLLGRAHALRGSALVRLRQPAEAAQAFEAAIAAEGASARTRVRYARFLLDRGQAAKAAEILEPVRGQADADLDVAEALVRSFAGAGKMLQADNLVATLRKQQPKDARLLFLQGFVQQQSGKLDEAVASFAEALALDEGRIDARVAHARALLAQGKLDEARTEIAAAVERAPDAPDAHTAQGEIRLAAQDYAAALAAFDAALRIDGEYVPAHLGRAAVLEKQADLPGAVETYRTVLAIDDAVPEHHLRLGSALWMQKDMDAAIAALETAQKLDPKNARVLSRLGAAQFDAGRIDAAIQSIEAALAIDNTSAESYLYLARFQQAKGDSSSAVHAVRRAMALDAKNAAYPYQLGLIYESANNPVEALDAFKAAVKLDPRHADALEHQGNVLVSLNAGGQAVKAYEAALALDPARTRLLLAVADTHLRNNRWEAAIAALQRASRDAGLRGVAYRLGVAYQEKGNNGEAVEWFQRAAREDPADAMPWRQLGYAYKERNRIGDAVTAFRRYLEKKPAADDRAEIEDEIATLRL